MAASSVTGKGPGSADGKNKGSQHMTLGAEKLIGPRIVAANSVTLDGSGNATVVLPVLPGSASDYIVMVTDGDVAAATACAAALAISASATTLTLKGTASTVAAYCVIKKGLAV